MADNVLYFPPSGAGFPSVEANIPSFPPAAAALNPYWPFPDIALPPFLWRPDLTGDYRNVGSDGAALNLAPVPGTPAPSFNQGWVISNPTSSLCSIVESPDNADVSALGLVFSIIGKVLPQNSINANGTTFVSNGLSTGATGGAGFGINGAAGQPLYYFIGNNESILLYLIGTILINDGIEYTIVLTFDTGTMRAYINGVEDTLVESGSVGTVTALSDTGVGVEVGDAVDSPGAAPCGDGTIIKVVAVAKGIAYTPAQVAEITAGLS